MFVVLLSLVMPVATADVGETVGNIWEKVLSVAGLEFLDLNSDNALISFARILIWFFIFTVFFAVIIGMGSGDDATAPMRFFTRGQAGVVAAIVATIASIFLPANILAATGAGWATIIALLLIGGPVVGLAALLWQIPWEGEETRGTVALKLVLCFLLLWLLAAMKVHVGNVL